MFFKISNKPYLLTSQLKTTILLDAYYVIDNYPLKATELLLDNYLKQRYKISLKNLCIKLLLNITFYIDNEKNIVLIFKDQEHDKLAQLITYGNGSVQGSRILKVAFANN